MPEDQNDSPPSPSYSAGYDWLKDSGFCDAFQVMWAGVESSAQEEAAKNGHDPNDFQEGVFNAWIDFLGVEPIADDGTDDPERNEDGGQDDPERS